MNVGQWIVTAALRIYKCAVSPVLHTLFGPLAGCRFHPTCSVYACQAVQRHGVARGSWLAVQRLGKCHPWGPCGCDPVPEVFGWSPSFSLSQPTLKCELQPTPLDASRGHRGALSLRG